MGYNRQQRKMKKLLSVIVALISVTFATNVSAQTRLKIQEGLYLVSYGNTVVIEDDINQRTVSMSVAQVQIDERTGQKIYEVTCGKRTKRTVKDGLKLTIAAGIAASGASGGTSLIVSAAATLATYIYDDVCEYYGDYYGDR